MSFKELFGINNGQVGAEGLKSHDNKEVDTDTECKKGRAIIDSMIEEAIEDGGKRVKRIVDGEDYGDCKLVDDIYGPAIEPPLPSMQSFTDRLRDVFPDGFKLGILFSGGYIAVGDVFVFWDTSPSSREPNKSIDAAIQEMKGKIDE